ncbi:hypothetical protein HPP92_021230 [Vanilla planifolia]|uniref:[RNA-polymerase]-subunit kinase n=1 Tax=Vanilla planifolia TaxID=51239 RepID=A0A835PZG4_VANPL|nr:hypothetical protein HPP92_021230 [Vanilla planifolia]
MGCLFAKPHVAGDRTPAGAESIPCRSPSERKQSPIISSPSEAAGWPTWLTAVAGESLVGWNPRSAQQFEKIDKIGSGTYSNVFKAKDRQTQQLVALKKVRCEAGDSESVRFMAREIAILRSLDHPNVVPLRGIITSRIPARSRSLYLIFDYMDHDLAGLAASPSIQFSLPQIKCYMMQLLSGLDHCHSRGVLHRDLKGSNLLIDNQGILKIADFGLANTFDSKRKQVMTSRVVTLWYRAPELILGATSYGIGIDLWSVGCILAELLAGKAILPGRTEVEQLHKIFKLCGSPPERYWKMYKFPHAVGYRPKQLYSSILAETFKDFPLSALRLVEKLLSFDPADRGTAIDALNSEFFTTEPLACEPSSLPREAERNGKANGNVHTRAHNGRRSRAVPAPHANAELQINLARMNLMGRQKGKTTSEKFPPPHQDGGLGSLMESPSTGGRSTASFAAPGASFGSSFFLEKEIESRRHAASKADGGKKAMKPTPIARTADPKKIKSHKRVKGELEVFGGTGM